ncbi:MAG: ABC transporter permease [Agarilytica sp.]
MSSPSPKISIALTRRLLWRDWKSGELNILLFSLLLAIATVTCISLFTSRIHNSIYEEASHFLAADAKITGSIAPSTHWKTHAQTLGLTSADILRFQAMAFSESGMTLSQVKAVSALYPLKGSLSIASTPFGADKKVTQGPKSGEVWIAPRLFNSLNINTGDKITIGEADFVVTASLNKEPDSGQSIFGVSPRVMMNIADIEKTQAVQTGSDIDYDWLLGGDPSTIMKMKKWLDPQIGEHHRWIDVKGGNISIDSALTRAERFLLLTGCLSVILSGLAIALAARRYAKRHQNQVALLKTLGCTPNNITRLYAQSILFIGLSSIFIGALLGWFLHWGIIGVLGDLIPTALAQPSWNAYITGAITGFISLWAFAAPPIFGLKNIPPASVLRSAEAGPQTLLTGTAIGVIAILGLMLFYSRDLNLTLIVSAGATVCVLGVGVISSLLIQTTRPLSRYLPTSWKLGLASLKRHKQFNTLQVVIFSLLFMLLFILLTVRTSLLSQWQNQLPENAPNHFVFNIFPDEMPKIKTFFAENNIHSNPFYPMTRGRVISVNGIDIKDIEKPPKHRVNYKRELNLTWSNTYGNDNTLTSGTWWDDLNIGDIMQVSAESSYAKGLGLIIGDTISYSVAGQTVEARVSSIRSVKWDSMNPNFYMIFDRPLLGGSSANWVTSFYLPSENKLLLNNLSRAHPTISIIEIDQTIEQVQSIVGKVSLAIEFILALVLSSGLLVLVTSIQATLDIRIQEGAIYRTLGAAKSLIRSTLLIEFITLGFLAGILAVAGTELCIFFLQTRVFDLPYSSQGWLWLWGPFLSGTLIGLTGWLSARKVVNTPPLTLLRSL